MHSVADLRGACALLPGSRETFPFGASTLVFKVAGKMYALTDLTADPLVLSRKVWPERGEELRTRYPAVRPGYHLNKRHWITVTLDGSLPDGLLRELLAGSHALVVAGLSWAQRAGLEENAASTRPPEQHRGPAGFALAPLPFPLSGQKAVSSAPSAASGF